MSEHVWSQENVAAYVAGGLDAAEGERLEKHVDDCPTCARLVDEARSLEKKLAPLALAADPGPALEDRIIQALPLMRETRRMATMSVKRKAVLAAAAAVLLAALGAGLSVLVEKNGLGFPAASPVKERIAGLREGKFKLGSDLVGGSIFTYDDSDSTPNEKALQGNVEDYYGVNRADKQVHTKEGSIASADELAKEVRENALASVAQQESKRLPPLHGGNAVGGSPAPPDDLAKVKALPDMNLPSQPAATPATSEPTAVTATGTTGASSSMARGSGGLGAPGGFEGRGFGGGASSATPASPNNISAGGGGPGGGYRGFTPPLATNNSPSSNPSVKTLSSAGWADFDYTYRSTGTEGRDQADKESKGKVLVWNYTNNGTLPSLGLSFFKPGDDLAEQNKEKASDKDIKDLNKKLSSSGKRPAQSEAPRLPVTAEALESLGIVVAAKLGEAAQKGEPPPEPPQAPRRIIIRTGDLEFEIESFDASVATILKLVSGAKGAFVATINSDKLPNGKVRGAIVVRVPPELLDNFVLDLRKELSKKGELKNQRIGSQDITKQYTDLESRLRAARAMEERLLHIIKDGKGQIKDLLAAEKELGVWRTQIESLEGELRYYGNQAAYSTLTIKLYEKNIRVAASITESERVQAGLEVEDVEKAHQQALKAIYDAKGRVTRSELKQHAAGQFNAILNFEVSYEAAGPLRDRLKQLGTMVRLQVDRVQQTEDGGPAPKDGKIERGPTLFLVSIYNLANVAPRETVILRLAAADVPAIFNKLRGVITIAKGHVINAQLDEKDRKNITAQLDFHVSRQGEGDVQAALLGAGETLTRQVNRIPENDNVTDAKVLFRITLVDADSIQPRETVVMRIAAADVPAAYQKLRDAVAKVKARVYTAQLNEQDRRNISAQLDFTLRRSDEAALHAALTGAGETLSRQSIRLPESPNLTDAKVLFQVTLFDVDAVQPRETVTVKIAAIDVPASYEKLRAVVAAAKGRIITAQINEQDRRNITAQLDVTMNRSDTKVLEEALTAAGETLSRLVTRAPDAANVTDAKVHAVIDLKSAAAIEPRETTTLALEVTDVPAILTIYTSQVKETQGRTVETQVGQERNGRVSARVIYDVPLNDAATLVEKFKSAGQVRVHQVTRDPQAPEGKLAIGRLVVTLSNTPLLVPSDEGLWSQLRGGLAFSLRGLSISASWLIVGLLFVLPWVLVLYAAIWLARRLWRGEPVQAAVSVSTAEGIPPAGKS